MYVLSPSKYIDIFTDDIVRTKNELTFFILPPQDKDESPRAKQKCLSYSWFLKYYLLVSNVVILYIYKEMLVMTIIWLTLERDVYV